jgi:hypothetical protein
MDKYLTIQRSLISSVDVMEFATKSGNGEYASPFGFYQLDRPFALTWTTISQNIDGILGFLHECQTAKVSYGFGAKVPRHGAIPGRDFTKIDCSGFVREALWRGTPSGQVPASFPDGSVVQHDWINMGGFRRAEIDDGFLSDGVLRISFLRPADGVNGVGHVALIHMGYTIESHGEKGPNRREWTGTGWQAKTTLYILDVPVT